MTRQQDQGLAQAIAEVARALQAETSAQDTLQKIVELAAATVPGCEHAGITMLRDGKMCTPAASSQVPVRVDEVQYDTDQGPCLDAIRVSPMFWTDDLTAEDRWPAFSARAFARTGVRSMLSFRLFLEQATLGALNLYASRHAAFGPDSRAAGEVFAAHAALALQTARERDRIQGMTAQLRASRQQARQYSRQAELAVALQRSMLTELPDLAPLQLAARYLPATEAAEIGGDWYDAFILPGGAVKLTVGDLAGHDVDAAGAMGQARSALRALAVDRREPPGQLLTASTPSWPSCCPTAPAPACAPSSARTMPAGAPCSATPGTRRPCSSPTRTRDTSSCPRRSCSAPAWRSSGPAHRSGCHPAAPCCCTPTG